MLIKRTRLTVMIVSAKEDVYREATEWRQAVEPSNCTDLKPQEALKPRRVAELNTSARRDR
jgi:hypothetical protein